MLQTLDQQRARAAWNATPQTPEEAYVSLCSGAPVMILTNGLGPTLAFFLAKAPRAAEYRQLGDALARWALRAGTDADTGKQAEDLMVRITNATTDEYRRLTAESLSYLNWLKRFAVARKEAPSDPS